MHEPLYFKQFLELADIKPSYMNAIQDELGIDPKTLAKTPQWAGNVQMGNVSYNGIMYQVTRMVYKNGQVSGAMIKPLAVQGVKSQRAYLNRDGSQIRSPNSTPDGSEVFLPIDKLNSLMTQGFNAAPPGGGMGGGLPI